MIELAAISLDVRCNAMPAVSECCSAMIVDVTCGARMSHCLTGLVTGCAHRLTERLPVHLRFHACSTALVHTSSPNLPSGRPLAAAALPGTAVLSKPPLWWKLPVSQRTSFSVPATMELRAPNSTVSFALHTAVPGAMLLNASGLPDGAAMLPTLRDQRPNDLKDCISGVCSSDGRPADFAAAGSKLFDLSNPAAAAGGVAPSLPFDDGAECEAVANDASSWTGRSGNGGVRVTVDGRG